MAHNKQRQTYINGFLQFGFIIYVMSIIHMDKNCKPYLVNVIRLHQ